MSWISFLIVALVGAGSAAVGWQFIRRECPGRWLVWLVLGAAILRLAAGVTWAWVLPIAGYGTPSEQYGYVMSDAYERDQNAWKLARSGKPVVQAFLGAYRKVDQYGGMLFLSALVYRYSGSPFHQPLLVVVLTAAFSALGVAFAWAFAHNLWGKAAAAMAAWGLALYPEAVLLGSSQMREAFSITLAIAAAYGLLVWVKERARSGGALTAACLMLSLPLSPPSAALLLFVLAILGVSFRGKTLPVSRTTPGVSVHGAERQHRSGEQAHLWENRWFWPMLAALAVVIATGLWLAWRQFAPEAVDTPLGVVSWWIKKSAEWNAHLSERASGWVQKIFDETPEWTHAPLLVAYGVAQPFLPAAIGDTTGAPIWRLIAIWRAAGWTLLLAFLFYALFRSLRNATGIERALSLSTWLVILVASFRGGGDAWDNPRYRLAFAGLQVALGAWVWAEQRRQPDPWLRRVLIGLGLVLAWFMPWYLRRYVHLEWPVADVFKTLGLGIASAVLYWMLDVVGGGTRGNQKGAGGASGR